MTRLLSRDARFVLAVLARTPIPISEIDVRLVHDLVDGPPEHTEQVLDDLLAAGEITDAGAGLWALTSIPPVDITAMAGRRARRGHDPVEVLLAWLVELTVEADREVSPHSWRLAVPGPDPRPYGGRRGAIEWWELHRAQLLRLVQDLVDRKLWPLAQRLAEAVWGLAQATGYAQAQATSQELGLWAVEQDYHGAVEQGPERTAGYLLRKAVFSTRLAFGLSDVGNHGRALRVIDQGVETARQAGDPLVLSAAFGTRARAVLAGEAVDRYDDAIHDLRSAIALDLGRHDPRGQGLRRRRLGELLAAVDQVAEAVVELDQAVELLRQAGDDVGRAVVLTVAGHLLVDTGRAGEALPRLREALRVLHAVGTPWELARVYHGLGRAAHATGAREIGLTYQRRAVDLYREANRPQLADDLELFHTGGDEGGAAATGENQA